MVAGPYTTNAHSSIERHQNLLALNRAAYKIFEKGHVPIIGVNMALPIVEAMGKGYFNELMMPMSYALAKKCDAVLRIKGCSLGADAEVDKIIQQGGQVFRSIDEIPSCTTT